MYKSELIIINRVYSTQCRVGNRQPELLNGAPLSEGITRTPSSCVAILLYTFELIILNGVYSTKCRVVNIQEERRIETSLSDGGN